MNSNIPTHTSYKKSDVDGGPNLIIDFELQPLEIGTVWHVIK